VKPSRPLKFLVEPMAPRNLKLGAGFRYGMTT